MTPKDTHIGLLPSGFIDMLEPEAEKEAKAISSLMKKYAAYGYQLIKPPFVEFEDSLLAPGPGAALAQETFRVMDPHSHRMMGIRSDMTPQIARIAQTRLQKQSRPLRLCYTGNVLRTKSNQQRPERQFTQVGCEIIGAENLEAIIQADIEACVLALQGLDLIGIDNITIDLSLPRLIGQLFSLYEISAQEQNIISKALEVRARDKVDGIFLDLLSTSGKPADESISMLKELIVKVSKEKSSQELMDLQEDINALEKISKGITRALSELQISNVSISIDPLEQKGFEYHDAFGFTLFAQNVRGELGRGGRYPVMFGGGEHISQLLQSVSQKKKASGAEKQVSESASGFTLYMDTIRKALPSSSEKTIVKVKSEESWSKIKKLQEDGNTVLRDL